MMSSRCTGRRDCRDPVLVGSVEEWQGLQQDKELVERKTC